MQLKATNNGGLDAYKAQLMVQAIMTRDVMTGVVTTINAMDGSTIDKSPVKVSSSATLSSALSLNKWMGQNPYT